MDNFVTLYFEVTGSLCSVHFHSNVHIKSCHKCLYLLHVLFINGCPQYEEAAAKRLPHIIPDCFHLHPFQFMMQSQYILMIYS